MIPNSKEKKSVSKDMLAVLTTEKKPIVTKVSQNLLLARFLIQQTHLGETTLNSEHIEKDEETVTKTCNNQNLNKGVP